MPHPPRRVPALPPPPSDACVVLLADKVKRADSEQDPTSRSNPPIEAGELAQHGLAADLRDIKYALLREIHRLDKITEAISCDGPPDAPGQNGHNGHNGENGQPEVNGQIADLISFQKQSTPDEEQESGCDFVNSATNLFPKVNVSAKRSSDMSAVSIAEGKEDAFYKNMKKLMSAEGEDYMEEKSCCRSLVQNIKVHKAAVLESFMGFVIITNAITIGISCDTGSVLLWFIVDFIFAVIYLLEFIVKFRVIGFEDLFLGEDRYWSIFELAILCLAWIELVLVLAQESESENPYILVFTRMFKLARVARLIRVLRLELFNELLQMFTGAMGSMRTLFWSCVIIFWPLYIASLLVRQSLPAAEQDFDSLPMTFFTLFRCLVPGECTDDGGRPIFYRITRSYGWVYGIIYIALVMFMTFGLFNVIVAIYVENVLVAAKTDAEQVRKNQLRNHDFFNRKMLELLGHLWDLHVIMCEEKGVDVMPNRNGSKRKSTSTAQLAIERLRQVRITEELFSRLLSDDKVRMILEDLEVADDDQLNIFGMLDVNDDGNIELPELYDGISKLRGPARRSDMVSNQMLLRSILKEMGRGTKGCL